MKLKLLLLFLSIPFLLKAKDITTLCPGKGKIIELIKSNNKIKKWVRCNYFRNWGDEDGIDFLIPQKKFLKRLKKHLRYLKHPFKKSASKRYKESNAFPHDYGKKFLNFIKTSDTLNLDEFFIQDLNISDSIEDGSYEIEKVVESFLIKGEISITNKGKPVSKILIKNIDFSEQDRYTKRRKKYKPARHLEYLKAGDLIIANFHFLEEDKWFYKIQRCLVAPLW